VRHGDDLLTGEGGGEVLHAAVVEVEEALVVRV
jgi:hypothetical protein